MAVADVQHDQDIRATLQQVEINLDKLRRELEEAKTAALTDAAKRHVSSTSL
jgi:hypothetical protein